MLEDEAALLEGSSSGLPIVPSHDDDQEEAQRVELAAELGRYVSPEMVMKCVHCDRRLGSKLSAKRRMAAQAFDQVESQLKAAFAKAAHENEAEIKRLRTQLQELRQEQVQSQELRQGQANKASESSSSE